jgi:hypothetical protein
MEVDLSVPQLVQQPESFRERQLAVVVFQVDVLGDPRGPSNTAHAWVLQTLGFDVRHALVGMWDVDSFPREGQASRIEVKVGHGAKTVKMERPYTREIDERGGLPPGYSPRER